MAELNPIRQSKYVPRQMNGPIINAFAAAQEEEANDAKFITEYLHDLSIDTAQEKELESIGLLIGFPRPIVPEGFNTENLFLLTALPLSQDAEDGFSDINGPGGLFTSTEEDPEGLKLSLSSYRKLLKVIAKVKRYGVTIKNIDAIAQQFDNTYTIEWGENKDINLTFSSSIGYKNVWLLTEIFYRVCTVPQINISSGGF